MNKIRVYLNRDGASKLKVHHGGSGKYDYICPLDNGEDSEKSSLHWVTFHKGCISEDGRPYRDMTIVEALELIPLLEKRKLFCGVSEAVDFPDKEGFPEEGIIPLLGGVLLSVTGKGALGDVYAVAYAPSVNSLALALAKEGISSCTMGHEFALPWSIKKEVVDSWESVILSFGLGLLMGIGIMWWVSSIAVH